MAADDARPQGFGLRLRPGAARAIGLGLTLGIVGLWVAPWPARVARPSLLSDDLLRLILLQRVPTPSRLILPFNEHLAPLFELVSTIAWASAGHRLEWAPLAFTVASFVPFVACLAALSALVRVETGSRTASWAAVTLFAGSPMLVECVSWYSASSFCWALFPTLIALGIAARSGGEPGPRGLGAIATCCLLAPMGSAVGLFAGPVVGARLRARPGRVGWRRAALRVGAPIAGTVAYLAIAGLLGHDEVVSESVRTHRDLVGGLILVGEAPAYLVLSGVFGLRDGSALPPPLALWGVSIVGASAVAIGLVRGDGEGRHRLLAASLLILLPYAGIFCVRTQLLGLEELIRTQRYHLFPLVGVVLLATSATVPLWRRLDGRPIPGRAAVVALGLAMAVVNGPNFADRLWLFCSFGDQRATLRSLDGLAGSARRLGIARDQVVRVLDPIVPRWSFEGGNLLELLPETAPAGADRPSRGDAEAREALIAALSPGDRASLMAGLDASGYLVPPADWGGAARSTPGRPGRTWLLDPEGSPGHYRAAGWPSFIEFEFGPESGDRPAEAIILPPIAAGHPVQLWWRGDDGSWSPSRSVTLPPPGEPSILKLADLPHWDESGVGAVRVVFPRRGAVAMGAPTLLR